MKREPDLNELLARRRTSIGASAEQDLAGDRGPARGGDDQGEPEDRS